MLRCDAFAIMMEVTMLAAYTDSMRCGSYGLRIDLDQYT